MYRAGRTRSKQTVIEGLGLTVSTISEDLAWQNGLSPAAQGLLVVALAPAGPASLAGLRIGDVIVEIDQDMTLASDQAMAALEVVMIESRRSLLFLLDRDSAPVFAVVRLTP